MVVEYFYYKIKFGELLLNANSNEIFNIMNIEMNDALCKCFTGRISRLVNCFDDNIIINRLIIEETISN